MAWQYLCSATYSGSEAYDRKFKATVQYNDATITTTSITLRCIGNHEGWDGAKDTYFICDKAGTFSRIIYLGNTDGSYTSNTFTISKDRWATSFSIPEMWICLDGQHQATVNYTDNNWRGHYAYFTSGRTGYKSVINSGGSTLATSIYVTDIYAGSTTIKDNGNNTFTITAKKGTDSTYNKAESLTKLKWGYTSNYEQGTYTSGQTISLAIAYDSTGKPLDTRTVYATSTTTAQYGSDKAATKNLSINQYLSPSQPGLPTITTDSYKNGRLVAKHDWKFTWTAAGAVNNKSPVKGYRIRIYKIPKGEADNTKRYEVMKLKLNTADGNRVYIDPSAPDNYYWIANDPNVTSIKFNPYDLGFRPGDKVQVGIIGYSQNGKGDTLWVGNGATSSGTNFVQRDSAVHEIQNAGVAHVKIGNSWKEGQVYIKVGTSWKEVETVNYKISNTWKESQ